jgi:hypothetical protein
MVRKQRLALVREKWAAANRRLLVALACYGILILIALYGLLPVRSSDEGFILGLVLFVFVILIVKTFAHAEDEKLD